MSKEEQFKSHILSIMEEAFVAGYNQGVYDGREGIHINIREIVRVNSSNLAELLDSVDLTTIVTTLIIPENSMLDIPSSKSFMD